MNDQPHPTQNMPDLAELSRALASISVRLQSLWLLSSTVTQGLKLCRKLIHQI